MSTMIQHSEYFRRNFWLTIAACALSLAASAATPHELLASGRIDDAIASLQQATPQNAETEHMLCRAYYWVQDWDHAITHGERAIALDSSKSAYYLWLARAYGEKADNVSFFSAPGYAKKARVSWERAVALDGSNAEARRDLAEFYFEAPGIVGGGQDKARTQAEALMKIDAAKAHWFYARIAEKNKDTITAEREYKASLDAGRGDADGWLNLALFYRHQERFDDMEKAMQQLDAAPLRQPEVLLDAAYALYKAGRNYPLATAMIRRYLTPEKMVEEGPAFKAHLILGGLLEKQGDKKSAADEYRAALTLARNYKPAQEALKRVS